MSPRDCRVDADRVWPRLLWCQAQEKFKPFALAVIQAAACVDVTEPNKRRGDIAPMLASLSALLAVQNAVIGLCTVREDSQCPGVELSKC